MFFFINLVAFSIQSEWQRCVAARSCSYFKMVQTRPASPVTDIHTGFSPVCLKYWVSRPASSDTSGKLGVCFAGRTHPREKEFELFPSLETRKSPDLFVCLFLGGGCCRKSETGRQRRSRLYVLFLLSAPSIQCRVLLLTPTPRAVSPHRDAAVRICKCFSYFVNALCLLFSHNHKKRKDDKQNTIRKTFNMRK